MTQFNNLAFEISNIRTSLSKESLIRNLFWEDKIPQSALPMYDIDGNLIFLPEATPCFNPIKIIKIPVSKTSSRGLYIPTVDYSTSIDIINDDEKFNKQSISETVDELKELENDILQQLLYTCLSKYHHKNIMNWFTFLNKNIINECCYIFHSIHDTERIKLYLNSFFGKNTNTFSTVHLNEKELFIIRKNKNLGYDDCYGVIPIICDISLYPSSTKLNSYDLFFTQNYALINSDLKNNVYYIQDFA